MTWMIWIIGFIFAADAVTTYVKVIKNEVLFYEDLLEVYNCACGSLCGLVALDIVSEGLKDLASFLSTWKNWLGFVICSLIFVWVLVKTYLKTKRNNIDLKLIDIWWLLFQKMTWAPIAAVGLMNAGSAAFGKNRSISERASGIFAIFLIASIFLPLVNGAKMANQRAERQIQP